MDQAFFAPCRLVQISSHNAKDLLTPVLARSGSDGYYTAQALNTRLGQHISLRRRRVLN